jgi:hypothetical protein
MCLLLTLLLHSEAVALCLVCASSLLLTLVNVYTTLKYRYCMLKVDALDRLKELLYYGSDAVEPRNLGAIVGVQQASLKVT